MRVLLQSGEHTTVVCQYELIRHALTIDLLTDNGILVCELIRHTLIHIQEGCHQEGGQCMSYELTYNGIDIQDTLLMTLLIREGMRGSAMPC